jgi:hypothetical protein
MSASDNTPPIKPLDGPLQPGDFYMEGPNLVFTAAYHLRRGYCCNSDCRHCPYKSGEDEASKN